MPARVLGTFYTRLGTSAPTDVMIDKVEAFWYRVIAVR